MAQSTSPDSAPPECRRSFAEAQKAPPKYNEDIIIAARVLSSIVKCDKAAWGVLESAKNYSIAEMRELAKLSSNILIYGHSSIDREQYKLYMHDFQNAFADTIKVLSRSHDPVLGNALISAKAGRAFVQSRLNPFDEGDNLHRLFTANPFLMVHIASDVLRDVNRELEAQNGKISFWPSSTVMFQYFEKFYADLHAASPVDLEPHQANEDQYRHVMHELQHVYEVINFPPTHHVRDDFFGQARSIGVLRNYIEPFGKRGKTDMQRNAIAREDAPSNLLDFEQWASRVLEARARREERRTAKPEPVL